MLPMTATTRRTLIKTSMPPKAAPPSSPAASSLIRRARKLFRKMMTQPFWQKTNKQEKTKQNRAKQTNQIRTTGGTVSRPGGWDSIAKYGPAASGVRFGRDVGEGAGSTHDDKNAYSSSHHRPLTSASQHSMPERSYLHTVL